MDETQLEDATSMQTDEQRVEAVEALKEEDTAAISSEKGQQNDSTRVDRSTPISASLQSLTDKTLEFLSHASNETLGACAVGLGAATYLVLGRVGLVIIGVAGGVVLHATWEGIRSDTRDEGTRRVEQERRRETAVEVVKRALDWQLSNTLDEKNEDIRVYANQQLDYSRFDPETATALNSFTDAVIKDYVYYWYAPQLPAEESFPASCRRTFTAFVLSLSGHLQRKRPADAFLDFVTNASSIIIVFLTELSAALSASPHSTPAQAIATYLELKPDSSLAYVVDEKSQSAKLGLIAEDILQAYLDPKSYNCEPVHVFLKEVLTQLVLQSTVTLCSKPEWINEWIVYGLEESETTKEVMELVDAGVEGRTSDKGQKAAGQQPVDHDVHRRADSEHHMAVENPKAVGVDERNLSKEEDPMDEAMREAKRLTQLMMEEDERRAREEGEKQAAKSSSEDVSDVATQGAATPSSSQSGRDRQEDDIGSWTSHSQAPSVAESPTVRETPVTPSSKQFTSFDQMFFAKEPTALQDSPEKQARPPSAQLTLHNAKIHIFDDSVPGEKTTIKTKPTADYLIQIEPASPAFPGWMIARQYADFETLHEVLRRISRITGVVDFTEEHMELPKWRTHTKPSLRSELELYLTDAVRYQPLAESEGMRRFLEKDRGLQKSPSAKGGFGWPTPDNFGKIGGDMMNVLTKAPKHVAGGGKAFVGGVAGGGKAVFGGVAGLVGGAAGNKRQSQAGGLSRVGANTATEGHRSRTSLAADGYAESLSSGRQSQDSFRVTPSGRPTMDRHVSTDSRTSLDTKPPPGDSPYRSSVDTARTEELATTPPMASSRTLPSSISDVNLDEPTIRLPPPPSEMPEDYCSTSRPPNDSRDDQSYRSTDTPAPRVSASMDLDKNDAPPVPPRPKAVQVKPKVPLSESETSVAVELMFAVITELYTLSSAWNIRRTLLTAAKTFLLRPGNPQLITIKELLQTSLLNANLSDSGMASHIYKLRENGLPTEEEMDIWRRDYPEKNDQQKEELRVKARQLLVQKGMPTALQSVMGAAASGEALGKVFDCLQVESVSRGLVFGLMLQALRVVTH